AQRDPRSPREPVNPRAGAASGTPAAESSSMARRGEAMKRALVVVLFVLGLSLARAQEAEPEFELKQEQLDKLVSELRPLVEKETGQKFAKAPTIEIGDQAKVRKLLKVELKDQIALLLPPNATEEQSRQLLKQQSSLLASLFLGKYCPSSGTIIICEE